MKQLAKRVEPLVLEVLAVVVLPRIAGAVAKRLAKTK
jgi:hypothetical protein